MLFYTLYSIFYILISWFRPQWALFLIFALLPTYQLRFDILGLPTTLLEVMIVILFACWLINKLKAQNLNLKTTIQDLKLSNWLWLILAWLLVGLLAVFVSPNRWLALGHWRAYFFEPILLLAVILSLPTPTIADQDVDRRGYLIVNQCPFTQAGGHQRKSALILFGLSISALYISIWAIVQKITGQGMTSLEIWQYPLQPIIRPTGPFPHSNFLGLFLGPLILLFLGQLINSFKNRKLLVICYWLLVIMASVLAIIFARSEGAILGVIIGLIFFLFFYLKKNYRLIMAIAIIWLLCFLLFFSPWQKTIWQKITFQGLSERLRLNIWQGAIELVKDRPIFGAGLRGYQILISQYQKPFSLPGVEGTIANEFHPYPHNLFLALWAELGFFGLIIFILIVFKFFKLGFSKIIQTIRTHPNTPNKFFNFNFLIFILAAMVVILVHGSVDTSYFKNDLSILFWIIVGLMVISSQIKSRETE